VSLLANSDDETFRAAIMGVERLKAGRKSLIMPLLPSLIFFEKSHEARVDNSQEAALPSHSGAARFVRRCNDCVLLGSLDSRHGKVKIELIDSEA